MIKKIKQVEQQTYGLDYDQQTKEVFYDGVAIARINNNGQLISNGITYSTDNEAEQLITILSLKKELLHDYFENVHGYGYYAIMQLLNEIYNVIDLYNIVNEVYLIDELDDEDREDALQALKNTSDDVVFYDGSSFHEIDDEIINEFLESVYENIVLYADEHVKSREVK